MKKITAVICIVLFSLILAQAAFAQAAGRSSEGVRGQSLNGTTGLCYIPTGNIGWEGGKAALDIGYRTIINNDAGASHIPAITLSLANWIEIAAAFDIQPNVGSQSNDDLLLGLKFRLPTSAAVALGCNIQFINIGDDYRDWTSFQPYVAITYPGTFFTMRAETTLVFGKTFFSGLSNNSDIDFGMGFDLILFPDVFGNTVHWLIDFSNFNYNSDAWPHNPAGHRGVMNTGVRIDLSTIPSFSKYKFLIDLILNDVFDDGHRSFIAGAVFGLRL